MDDENSNESLLDYGFGSSGYGYGSNQYLPTTVSYEPDEFDQDWSDVMAGRFTIDDVTSGRDITGMSEVAQFGSDWTSAISNIASKIGKSAFNSLKSTFTKPDGSIDWGALATAGVGLYSQMQKGETGGYNKPVPKMDVIAARPVYDDTNRRPGEAGRRYFTNPLFVAQGDTANAAAATTASNEQAAGLAAAAPQYAAPPPNPYIGKIPTKFNPPAAMAPASTGGLPSVITPEQYATQGGIKMAQGGIADAGRYLRGKTDGMADEIETSIDEEQPALLSHGEFVVPADVVSHLGNGNSEAGAEKLYEMMDRVRMARTGTKEQGREINPDKYLAAAGGGLAAAYSGGGEVQRFNTGNLVTANPTATGAGGVPLDVSRTSTLSPWVGDYVTNALGQGAALASAPYQAYQGPLTAGASNLQQQAFAGASDLATAGYTPGTFTGGFGTTEANKYMNPYLQASLDPQLKELQRQSDIQRVADAGRLTQAGAFGGSRQAIMESEGRRNLLDKQADLIGSGYKTAYDTGLGQFNKERAADEESRQFSANYGLKSVGQLADLGAVERGITSEGLAADKAQFQEERDFAYKMPQYQLGLLSGLPIGSNTTAANQDAISKLSSDVGGLASLYQKLANLKLG